MSEMQEALRARSAGGRSPEETEILDAMKRAEVAAVATLSGETIRSRMMHFAVDDDFTVYLSSMRGDPKTIQVTHFPSISILVHDVPGDVSDSTEVEFTGRASLEGSEEVRRRAFEAIAGRSPVVRHLVDAGNTGLLDCIRVVPHTIKLRRFREIVQGKPPTVLDFPQNRDAVSDWAPLWGKVHSWFLAVRPSFLTASLVPVLLGAAVAWADAGVFRLVPFILTLLAAALIQAGHNLLNDYLDHRSGVDAANREFVRPFTGGSRVIQLGLLAPYEVLGGAVGFLVLACLAGLYLVTVSGPWLLVLIAFGMFSGLFYTGTSLDLVRLGLGEALIGLNFGVLMTLGTFYVQTGRFAPAPVISSLPVAILISAVLFINQFQDYAADRRMGKLTLVVRLGKERAARLFVVLMSLPYLTVIAGAAAGVLPAGTLLALAGAVLAFRAVRYARAYHDGSFDLAPANGFTVMAHLTTGFLMVLGYSLAGFSSLASGVVYSLLLAGGLGAFTVYMWRYIEWQKRTFMSLKRSMG